MMPLNGLAFFAAAAAFAGEPALAAAPEAALDFGRAVVNRRLLDTAGPFVAGERAVAFTTVAGVTDGFIEHVWYRDGQEVARHYLPVGSGRRWRTWSRQQLQAGHYTIEVLGPDGQRLARKEITVEASLPMCGA